MAEQQNVQVQEQDLNQLRKVRREKLAELQGNGKDPFVITKYDQSHHSADIKADFDFLKVTPIIREVPLALKDVYSIASVQCS